MVFFGNSGRFVIFGFMLILGSGLFAQNFRAIMERGNGWLTENPGFGDRAIAALFGEYHVETAAGVTDGQSPFLVRVSTDQQILKGEGWQIRPGAASYLQRREGANLFIGFPFNGGVEVGNWVILFQFPADNTYIDQLLGAWTNRFRYFISLIRMPSDMSLPAVVNF